MFPHAEFTFNSSFNCSTVKTPFQIVYGLYLIQPLDWVPLLDPKGISCDAEFFATHLKEIHEDVQRKIQQTYEQ